jgi:hypothetical protein
MSSNPLMARCSRQVGSFLREFRFRSTNKTDRHDITEILLKVALNTTTLTRTLAFSDIHDIMNKVGSSTLLTWLLLYWY